MDDHEEDRDAERARAVGATVSEVRDAEVRAREEGHDQEDEVEPARDLQEFPAGDLARLSSFGDRPSFVDADIGDLSTPRRRLHGDVDPRQRVDRPLPRPDLIETVAGERGRLDRLEVPFFETARLEHSIPRRLGGEIGLAPRRHRFEAQEAHRPRGDDDRGHLFEGLLGVAHGEQAPFVVAQERRGARAHPKAHRGGVQLLEAIPPVGGEVVLFDEANQPIAFDEPAGDIEGRLGVSEVLEHPPRDELESIGRFRHRRDLRDPHLSFEEHREPESGEDHSQEEAARAPGDASRSSRRRDQFR